MNLPCCQCTETYSHVHIQNIYKKIYTPVSGVSNPVENCSYSESTCRSVQCVIPFIWCQTVFRRTGHGRVIKTLDIRVGIVTYLFQAPVPLSIFRSNSKFDENSKHSSVKYTRPITTIFCTRHDSVTVVTCAKYRCDRSSIFETRAFWIFIEFDRNMLSGTGARPLNGHWVKRLIIPVPVK